MAAVADNRVWKLLDDHEIHDDVKKYLRDVVKIKTTDDLATYLDAASEVQAKVLDHLEEGLKADAHQSFKLKQAWRIAHDDYEKKRQRARGAFPHEDMDMPLDPEVQSSAHENLHTVHKFTFRSHDCCADGLFARIFHEGQKWTNTFVKIEKVKDQRLSQVVTEPKKSELMPNLQIVQGQADSTVYIAGPLQYLHGVRVYCNMLAAAGTHTVSSNTSKNEAGTWAQVHFCPLQDSFDYGSHAEEKVIAYYRKHPQAPQSVVMAWLRNADEQTRYKVMELVRTKPKHTVGEALTKALHDCSHEWAIPNRNRSRSRSVQGREPLQRRKSEQPGTTSHQHQSDQSDQARLKTGQHCKGKQICKKRHDAR